MTYSAQAEAKEAPSATTDQHQADRSLSNYSETIEEKHSAKSVEAELVDSDKTKPAIFPIDVLHPTLNFYFALLSSN